jgi:hypothetical protein
MTVISLSTPNGTDKLLAVIFHGELRNANYAAIAAGSSQSSSRKFTADLVFSWSWFQPQKAAAPRRSRIINDTGASPH